jgi:hypothetical protein
MEKINVTPVTSAYASWQTEEPLVELPTDEINIEKAEEVGRVINSVEDHLLFEAVENLKDSGKKMAYAMGVADGQRELVQQSMSTLKELTNNPEVQKALESEGLTVDYSKVQAILNAEEVTSTSGMIRTLTPEEADAVEGGTCACNDCVESTDSDVDTDTMLIVHDLSERLAALEARIALFNGKASHKI